MKPDTWLGTLNCAIEGILHAVRTQRHMRWHVLACLAILIFTPRLPITPTEFALLCLAAAGVIVAELVNTALEEVVNLASPEFHPLAGAAKDVAAGAVLVGAFAAAAVGWVVLFPKFEAPAGQVLAGAANTSPVGTVALLLAVLVLIVILKALIGKGRPLHGGFPSGHAAVAFAVATWLALRSADATVAVLSLLLAAMVGHSRLLLRIHTRGEVAAGAAVGGLAALLLYRWFA